MKQTNHTPAQDGYFREIFTRSNDAGFVIDPTEWVIEDANQKAGDLLCYPRDELVGLPVATVHPDDFDELARFVTAEAGSTSEFVCITKHGERIAVEVSLGLIEHGDRRRIIAWVRDIRDRRRALEELLKAKRELQARVAERTIALQATVAQLQDEIAVRQHTLAELRDSQDRYRQLVELSPESIIVHCDEVIEYVNPATLRLLGASSADELVGRPMIDFVHSESLPAVEARRDALRTTDDLPNGSEFNLKGLDGQVRHVVVSSGAITYDGRPARQVISRDITTQKEADAQRAALEHQLRHAQKMEAIGTLAGGISHDFNNLLTVVGGHAALALGELPPTHPARRRFEDIRQAADRAGLLTRQLLAFGRRQPLHPRRLDLNAIVSGTHRLLSRALGEDVILALLLDPALDPVTVDGAQMEQVLVNLVLNARDAMPSGGALSIETARTYVSELDAHETVGLEPGYYSRLIVRDSGRGMDEDTAARAFEPFFTTKPSGKGSGLGLAMAYGIVTQSNGHITLETASHKGTQVLIWLPATPGKTEDVGEPSVTEANVPGGTETVLLVEDDVQVRELTENVLTKDGYRVIAAGDGEEALQLATDRGAPIDLVLTDLVLPGMDGQELATRVRALCETTRVMYMSGYTAERRDGARRDTSITFLAKPFAPAALSQTVRKVLDATPS